VLGSPASADEGGDADAGPTESVRPEELIEVPAGMILRPKAEDGARTTFRPDQEYKCFTAVEWSQMGHLVTDYRWLWHNAILMEKRSLLLEQQIGNLELQLGVLSDDVAATRRGLDSMTGLLEKEHARRIDSESARRFEVWLWRIGTVVGLVAAGAFGAAYGVERSR
jgi:hypothetical protein